MEDEILCENYEYCHKDILSFYYYLYLYHNSNKYNRYSNLKEEDMKDPYIRFKQPRVWIVISIILFLSIIGVISSIFDFIIITNIIYWTILIITYFLPKILRLKDDGKIK